MESGELYSGFKTNKNCHLKYDAFRNIKDILIYTSFSTDSYALLEIDEELKVGTETHSTCSNSTTTSKYRTNI
jgi:hypothetical protein